MALFGFGPVFVYAKDPFIKEAPQLRLGFQSLIQGFADGCATGHQIALDVHLSFLILLFRSFFAAFAKLEQPQRLPAVERDMSKIIETLKNQ